MNEGKITIEGVEYDKNQLSALVEKKEKIKEYQKAYRKANAERCKALQRTWYEKNKEYVMDKQKLKNAKERELIKLAKEHLGK